MDRQAEMAIELACEATTVRFFFHVDRQDDGAAAKLFEPDGVWERQGRTIRGQVGVTNALAERPEGRRTCHVLTNLITTVLGDRSARVEFCLSTYEGSETEGGAAPVGRLAGLRRCVDEMVFVDDGWRIARKSSEAVFRGM